MAESLVVQTEQLSMEEDQYDKPQERTKVYFKYNFNNYLESAKKLPVNTWRKEIIQAVGMETVTIVQGATGSGKSTQVPQYILDHAVSEDKDVNIVVAQPRRIAAMSLARRVCEERKFELGKLVGYQVGLDHKVDSDTRLSFVTTEVLIQKIIHKRSFSEYTHIIVDEVHERDIQTDFLLLLIKKLLMEGEIVKVVLMSATINEAKFKSYFSTSVNGLVIDVPQIMVSKTTLYPVDIKYLDHVLRKTGNGKYEPDDKFLSKRLLQIGGDLVQAIDRDEETLDKKGTILVFLPGVGEIEAFIDCLSPLEELMSWELLPLHSMLPANQQRRIFEPVRPGYRKIIAATNIAESSLTINDCVYVIDFCLVKQLTCSMNYTSLQVTYASVANCKQRAGRTGRVGRGIVYRMVSREFFERFPEYGSPEMERVSLASSVLKAKRLDMGSPQSLMALAIDPPPREKIRETILKLKEIGALTVKAEEAHDDSGQMTYIGDVASILPMDPHMSKLIVLGSLFGCTQDAITLACGMSVNNLFSRPFRKELKGHMNKLSLAYGSGSDCVALINAYRLWETEIREGRINRVKDTEEWAYENFIQPQGLRDMRLLIQETRRRLELKGLKFEDKNVIDDEYMIRLKVCIAGAFYPLYYQDTPRKSDSEDFYRDLNDMDPYTTIKFDRLPHENPECYQKDIEDFIRCYFKDYKVVIAGRSAFVSLIDRPLRMGHRRIDDEQIFSGRIMKLCLGLKLKSIPRIRKILSSFEKRYESAVNLVKTAPADSVSRAILPRPEERTWEVIPLCIEDPSTFWVIQTKNAAKLQEVEKNCEQNRDRFDAHSHVKPSCVQPGRSFLLIKGSDVSRVTVLSFVPPSSCHVVYLDRGGTEKVPINSLRNHVEYCPTERLAVQCKLAHVVSHPEKGWPKAAYRLTESVVEFGKPLTLEIFSVENDILYIDVKMDGEDGMTTLERQMLKNHYAIPRDPVHISVENNRKRKQYLESASHFLAVDRGDHTRKKGVREVFRLEGPTNPLESRFNTCYSMGLSDGPDGIVEIDNDSVNSPCIDVDPDSEVPQLLVAAQCCKNSSGKKLRWTTLMPRVRGLCDYLTLMFCPTAHMMTTKSKGLYKGYVAGLGCWHDGESISPKTDCFNTMSIVLDNSFLKEINEIRYIMSSALACLKDTPDFSLSDTRERLTRKLEHLISRETRSFSTVDEKDRCHNPLRDNRWMSIPNKDLHCPNPYEDPRNAVFPMIYGSLKVPE